jgi:hypothetical protein
MNNHNSRFLYGELNKTNGDEQGNERDDVMEKIFPLLDFDVHNTELRSYWLRFSGKFVMMWELKNCP